MLALFYLEQSLRKISTKRMWIKNIILVVLRGEGFRCARICCFQAIARKINNNINSKLGEICSSHSISHS